MVAALSARSGAPPTFLALLERRTDLLSACLTVRVARNSLLLVCARMHRSHWFAQPSSGEDAQEHGVRCFLFNATGTLEKLRSALEIACGNSRSSHRMHVFASAPDDDEPPLCTGDERALSWSVLSHTVMRHGRLRCALTAVPAFCGTGGICASALAAELNVWGAVPASVRKLWLDAAPGVRPEHVDSLRWLLCNVVPGSAACRAVDAFGGNSGECNCFLDGIFASAGAGCVTLHCCLPPRVRAPPLAADARERMPYGEFVDELQRLRGMWAARRHLDRRIARMARTAASLVAAANVSSDDDDDSSSSSSSSRSYASSCSGSHPPPPAPAPQSCHAAVLMLFRRAAGGTARDVLTAALKAAAAADCYYAPPLRYVLQRGARVSASLLRVSSRSTYALACQLRDDSPWLYVARVLEATQQDECDYARMGSNVALLLLLHERVREHTLAYESRATCSLQAAAHDLAAEEATSGESAACASVPVCDFH